MSKDGYYGDFESFSQEQEEYRKWINSQHQEPNVVPCKCGNPMYETEEMCDQCKSTKDEKK